MQNFRAESAFILLRGNGVKYLWRGPSNLKNTITTVFKASYMV